MDCGRCGRSCHGLRARVQPEERHTVEALAAELAVARPFSGDHLRQVWGRCVFYDRGCRLHRAYGPMAKPAMCRAFPTSGHRYDPACFHPPPAPVDLELDDDLAAGDAVRAWLDSWPFLALLDGPVLGAPVADDLRSMVRAQPREIPARHRGFVADLVQRAETTGQLPLANIRRAILGGAHVLAGSDDVRASPSWIRVLLLGCPGLDAALEQR